MHEIRTQGPVEAVMEVYTDFFMYASGVYQVQMMTMVVMSLLLITRLSSLPAPIPAEYQVRILSNSELCRYFNCPKLVRIDLSTGVVSTFSI